MFMAMRKWRGRVITQELAVCARNISPPAHETEPSPNHIHLQRGKKDIKKQRNGSPAQFISGSNHESKRWLRCDAIERFIFFVKEFVIKTNIREVSRSIFLTGERRMDLGLVEL
jgi:hypothetical protein